MFSFNTGFDMQPFARSFVFGRRKTLRCLRNITAFHPGSLQPSHLRFHGSWTTEEGSGTANISGCEHHVQPICKTCKTCPFLHVRDRFASGQVCPLAAKQIVVEIIKYLTPLSLAVFQVFDRGCLCLHLFELLAQSTNVQSGFPGYQSVQPKAPAPLGSHSQGIDLLAQITKISMPGVQWLCLERRDFEIVTQTATCVNQIRRVKRWTAL